jgi:hypothetical protein
MNHRYIYQQKTSLPPAYDFYRHCNPQPSQDWQAARLPDTTDSSFGRDQEAMEGGNDDGSPPKSSLAELRAKLLFLEAQGFINANRMLEFYTQGATPPEAYLTKSCHEGKDYCHRGSHPKDAIR